MIKISANISKKTPIPGQDFSSQQFGAAMEIEVSDADTSEVIHARIRDLYGLLSSAVDAQIAAAQIPAAPTGNAGAATFERRFAPPPVQQQTAASVRTGHATSTNGNRANGNGNGNGNRRMTMATAAQQKAIWAIAKSLNLDLAAVLADYNVAEIAQLNVKQASQVIDDLKSRQNSNVR
ncbi:MAG TPA: hypothetical protein VGP72_03770 [Planctomycetota bacterium]